MKKKTLEQKISAEFFEYVDSSVEPTPEFTDNLKEKLLQDYINYYDQGSMNNRASRILKFALASFALVGVTVASVFGGMFFLNLQEENKYSAQVVYSEGIVEFKKPNGDWEIIEKDVLLKKDYSVRVSGDGIASLKFFDGNIVRLSNDTTIDIKNVQKEEVILENVEGSLYVSVEETNVKYQIAMSNSDIKLNKGIFLTENNDEEKKIKVFKDSVNVSLKDQEEKIYEIPEGKKLYIKAKEEEKQNKPVKITKDEVSEDKFILANKELDKDTNKDLGYLDESVFGEIKIEVQAKGDGILVSFEKLGSPSLNGFKIIKSLSDNPVFGKDESIYVEVESKGEKLVGVKDGKTYYFRVCEYNGFGCVVNSVVKSAVAPVPPTPTPKPVVNQPAPTKKPSPTPTPAPTQNVNITSINGNINKFKVFWSFSGSATQGFKVVYSKTSPNPTFGIDASGYFGEGSTYGIVSGIPAGTYNVRVCRYTGSGCDSYSQTVSVNVTE